MMRIAQTFRSKRGSIAIEYALLLPALMLFVLGLMEVGRMLWTQTTLDRAVEAAARCRAVDATTCGDDGTAADYAATQAFGLKIDSDAFTVSSADCGKLASVTFTYKFLVPWVTPTDMELHANACYPLNE